MMSFMFNVYKYIYVSVWVCLCMKVKEQVHEVQNEQISDLHM